MNLMICLNWNQDDKFFIIIKSCLWKCMIFNSFNFLLRINLSVKKILVCYTIYKSLHLFIINLKCIQNIYILFWFDVILKICLHQNWAWILLFKWSWKIIGKSHKYKKSIWFLVYHGELCIWVTKTVGAYAPSFIKLLKHTNLLKFTSLHVKPH